MGETRQLTQTHQNGVAHLQPHLREESATQVHNPHLINAPGYFLSSFEDKMTAKTMPETRACAFCYTFCTPKEIYNEKYLIKDNRSFHSPNNVSHMVAQNTARDRHNFKVACEDSRFKNMEILLCDRCLAWTTYYRHESLWIS
ncbi:MAG: hypothetical protein FRX48_08262 [Lasallia pustulata]|uniref:Uncharacterized protein n=1 Tax=Lasallia pustulata TaxID=136370 RepID=A0A5M8PF15_9LECA|nr:MAG: hypothetical protein FRX48_08262 [Lasallia pustulata]